MFRFVVGDSLSSDHKRTSSLVDELLNEIYARFGDVAPKSTSAMPG